MAEVRSESPLFSNSKDGGPDRSPRPPRRSGPYFPPIPSLCAAEFHTAQEAFLSRNLGEWQNSEDCCNSDTLYQHTRDVQ